MENSFKNKEKLYRAVWDKPNYVKNDGTISSNAFSYTGRGSNGVSVDRQLERCNEEAVNKISETRSGLIVSVCIEDCIERNMYVEHTPSVSNAFHSEIFGNDIKKKISKSQKAHLARKCVIEVNPTPTE